MIEVLEKMSTFNIPYTIIIDTPNELVFFLRTSELSVGSIHKRKW